MNPRVIFTTKSGLALYEWILNTPPKEKARHYVAEARKARLAGDARRAAMMLGQAALCRREVMPRPTYPAAGDFAGWRAFYRRDHILFSRARGRKLSRVLHELDAARGC